MKQTRLMSLVEAVANVVVGYGVAVVAQILVFPVFGLQTTLAQNLKIGLVFSGVSIIRSFTLRRLFEVIRDKSSRPRKIITPPRDGRRLRPDPVDMFDQSSM